MLAGHYAEGLATLKKIEKTPDREAVRQDIEFYKALCSAKLAMTGNMKIADAGRMMKTFADANTKSYHYFEASQVVGDLLVAAGFVRSRGGILRPARRRPLARLQDAGGRGGRPRPAGKRKPRSAGRIRQGAWPPRPRATPPRHSGWRPAWARPPPWSL